MTFRSMGLVMLTLFGGVALAVAQAQGAKTPPASTKGAAGPSCPVSGLTSEQQTKIAALRDAAMVKVAPLRGELNVKMSEMRQLWVVEKPDRKAIVGKQSELGAIHQKMWAIWTDFGLEVHALLTPAQRGEWAQNLGQGRGMGMGMMGTSGPKGRRGAGLGRGRGMGMGQGMEGCPCGTPICPMGQP
jgi:Spy/CpxP family protein refolding chaperone